MQIDIQVWQALALEYGARVVTAVIIFFVGKWLANKLTSILAKLLEKNSVDLTLVKFLRNVTYYLLLAAILVAVAGELGINTASFLTIIGAASLAIGLAMKDSLANFSSGVMLILFRPFRVGDYIVAGGEAGTVEEIAIFNTILNTPDNKRKIVPNGAIANSAITNVTANPTRRLDLSVGISYDDDIRQAKGVLEQILAEQKELLAEPAPIIAVSELGESAVTIVARPWVKTEDYWTVYFQLTEKIKLRFDEAGITIPFPQRVVHLSEQAQVE